MHPDTGGVDHALTEIERRLLAALRLGLTNKEIARSLNKSEHTVRNQLHVIYRKLDVKGRTHAVAIATASTRSQDGQWINRSIGDQ